MRPRLVVLASTPDEAVRSVGGWLFDRSMAGWDVSVLTSVPTDPRALRILGVRAYDLEPVLAMPARGRRPQALAVAADLYDADSRVRRMVDRALDCGDVDCRLFADRRDLSDDMTGDEGADAVRHRLSTAARAFKAQAVAALGGAAEPVAAIENLRQAEMLRRSTRV